MEVDGNIVFFNEAEAVAALDESEEEPVKKRGKKTKGNVLLISGIFQSSL
ncbi:MAG: hypothetical protein ACLROG_20340 [Coprococcus phoceensis]